MTSAYTLYLGNTAGAWLTAIGVGVAVFLGLVLFKRIVLRRLERLAAITHTDVDDAFVAVLKSTKTLTILAISIYVGSHFLELNEKAEHRLWTAFLFVMLFQGAVWANHAIGFFIGRMTQRRSTEDPGGTTTMRALGFVARLVVWSIFLLMALDNFGVNVTGLVAGLGIGGVAVALAMQNILGDLFASLSIVLDKPFEVGDFIIVGEFLGAVERIGLKTTRVRSLSGEQIIFANNDLLNSRIRNFKRMAQRRVVFLLRVVLGTPPDLLAVIPAMIREAVEAQADVRFDRSNFQAIGESAHVFETVYYISDPDYNLYMNIQEAINLGILRSFADKHITLAYPTRTVMLEMPMPSAKEDAKA